MHRYNEQSSSPKPNMLVRSYWSDEDNAWLAEVVGVSGTLTHAETEQKARRAAQDLAEEWRRIETESRDLSLDDFARWMDLTSQQQATLRTYVRDDQSRRPVSEWSRILAKLIAP